MLSINPSLTYQDISNVLASSAEKIGTYSYVNGRTAEVGYGRINAYEALKYTLTNYGGTLTQNVAGAPGDSWTFLSGVTVNLNGYAISTIGGGAITVQSGATVNGWAANLKSGSNIIGLHPTIQSAVNAASANQSIELFSTTYSESPSFSSKSNISLQGQGPGSTTLNGWVSITNSSFVSVSGLSMNGPLIANNNYFTCLDNVAISGSTVASVYYGSLNEFGWVTASNLWASFGLYAYGGSGDLYYSTLSNADCGAYLTNYATYNIGTNNTFCENGYDIDANAGGYAYAISNLYSRALPSSIYGNVFVTGQNGVCGMAKASFNPAVAISGAVQTTSSDIKELDDMYLTLLRMIREDRHAGAYECTKYHPYYQQLIDGYRGLITEEASRASIVTALSKLSQLYDGLEDRSAFWAFLQQQLTGGRFKSAESCFRRYLIREHLDTKEYDVALTVADDVLTSMDCDEQLAAEMLFEKGMVYKYYFGDLASARKMYDDLAARHPSSPLVSMSNIEAGGSARLPGARASEAVTKVEREDMDLHAYPNPFNPVTYLAFNLKEPSEVRLAVYDLLGRSVTELADSRMEAGRHTASWNASGFGSGVYYARLTVTGKSEKPTLQVRTLLLVK